MKWVPGETILVDSNILVLVVIGTLAPERIERFSRTKKYTTGDFETVGNLISGFRWSITTPHVLSQVSDLLDLPRLDYELSAAVVSTLRHIYATNIERHVPARSLAKGGAFPSIGLADCSIIEAARRGCTVLTDDLSLHNTLRAHGYISVNFTEVRFA
jgi:hypothetical protein